MRVLIVWDDVNEVELLRLYLSAGGAEVASAWAVEEQDAQVISDRWDVVLLSLTAPDGSDTLSRFQRLRQQLPGVPMVLACREGEMIQLPRYLTQGLQHYLIRDSRGDFRFLLLSALEAAVAAARAEESRKLAERLREELEGVRRLQESIIPKGLVPPRGYQVVARYEPSQVSVLGDRPVVLAGGDYYDVFCPDDRTLVVLLGDASGHGLKACMSIMTLHTLIRMLPGKHFQDTAAFVTEINNRLCESSIVQSDGGFITLFYAAIDTLTHTMRWTSAGHPLPLLHLVNRDEVRPLGGPDDGGLPLGIAPHGDYTAQCTELPAASRVLLYTDGLADAFPLEGSGQKVFGVPGISAALHAGRAETLEVLLDHMLGASHAFTAGSGRHDDTSVVLLERCAAVVEPSLRLVSRRSSTCHGPLAVTVN
jgi:serine phosphatase RsbU (regulator of sigma subunit)